MAWTCGLPGLSALAYRTPASLAMWAGVPVIYRWKASLTRSWVPALVSAAAQLAG
jgi:hypothetical protein